MGDLLSSHRPWTGLAVDLVARRSIGGLKRTHTLVGKSRLMSVLKILLREPGGP